MMDRAHNRKGFTLAELLITLIVTGILLSALATLAYALSSATSTESDIAVVQAQLRLGGLRLHDLVANCRMICEVEGNALAIWRADDNQDGQINVNELVYLDAGDTGDTLRVCTFSSASNPHVTFSSAALSMTKAELIAGHDGVYTGLIPDAENVQFTFDVAPPLTQQLTTSFDLTEDGRLRHYQIDTALRAWAGHLLNEAGDTLVSDDDE
jgi:prepilin-type N-terminal cleavage/methylation domain-containing protein